MSDPVVLDGPCLAEEILDTKGQGEESGVGSLLHLAVESHVREGVVEQTLACTYGSRSLGMLCAEIGPLAKLLAFLATREERCARFSLT